MKPGTRLKNYLREKQLMQLATAANDRPWVCTVHYVVDGKMNVYWLSWPTRRHSQEIASNENVAITIPVKFDMPVIGVQAEGTAKMVSAASTVKSAMKLYVEKYGIGQDFYNNFIAGKNKHVMYQLTPRAWYLIDELNYPGKGRFEVES